MNAIFEILRALVGLFVDDEWLAVGVLGVVGLSALVIHVFATQRLAAGCLLLLGNMLVLVVGAIRTVRRNAPLAARGEPERS